MANSYYQTPTTPRLYVSYPLWQYANGGLDFLNGYINGEYDAVPHEDMIKLIQLDPSDPVSFDWTSGTVMPLRYGIVPTSMIEAHRPYKLWDFNYSMVLNHNLASAGVRPYPREDNIDFNVSTAGNISWNNILNMGDQPEYDGFTIIGHQHTHGHIMTHNIFHFGFWTPDSNTSGLPLVNPIQIGTIMWGKYFDFPQNCDLNTTLTYEYGTSSVKSVGGKSINTTQWTKPDSWYNQATGGTEPFGLRKPGTNVFDTADSFRRRSGLRVWNISFDSVLPNRVMNQNPMMNSNGWNHNFDNYDLQADGTSSLYTIDIGYEEWDSSMASYIGLDFYTNVVHKTNGGSLAMVMQIDKDDTSPQNFAIVKMSKYTITQKAPNLYSFSLTLEEQV